MLKKAAAFIIGIITIVGVLAYFYIYQDHKNISESKTFKSFTPASLLAVFTDEDLNNDKEVLDQVIEVTGTITEKSDESILLENQVFVKLIENQTSTVDEKITVKGLCIGYDDLIGEIKIVQASIIKN